MLTPLPLPQRDHHLSHITLAFPLPGEAPAAATSSEGPEAPYVCAHCPCDVRPWYSKTHTHRASDRRGAHFFAHFLQRKASRWVSLTKVTVERKIKVSRERRSSMEEGEVSCGEAEERKGENKTKGQKPRPGSSWPRPLTATAQQK